MSMILEIHAESGYLNVVAAGTFSLAEAERTFLQIIEAIELHKRSKVLFDGRDILGVPETMERFYYGEFAAKAALDVIGRGAPVPQFAYVLREPIFDRAKFGEGVAVNRGMWVKTFENPEEALHWLGMAPAPEMKR